MSWNAPFPIRDGEDEAAMKLRYAELRVKFPSTPHHELVLTILTGDDNIGRAYQAAFAWDRDFDVLEAIENFKNGGYSSTDKAPDKDEFCKEVLAYARTEEDAKAKLEAFKLYANMKGFIEKPGVTVNNNTLTVNKVMKVSVASSDDEWERKVAAQQDRLINVTPVN